VRFRNGGASSSSRILGIDLDGRASRPEHGVDSTSTACISTFSRSTGSQVQTEGEGMAKDTKESVRREEEGGICGSEWRL